MEYFESLNINNFFTQEEKKLLVKLSGKEEKIDIIDVFSFSKNNSYFKYFNLNLFKANENVENFYGEKKIINKYNRKYLKNLYELKKDNYYIGNNDESIEKVIKILLENFPKECENLLERYLNSKSNIEQFNKVEDSLIKTINKISFYLKENNLKVENYHINSENDLKEFKKKKIKEKIFPAYNDLDLEPFLLDNDYCFNDYSSAKSYLVKKEKNNIKIYQNSTVIDFENDEDFVQKLYDLGGKQVYFKIHEKTNENNLIGEIENGKIIKASYSLSNFYTNQIFIFNELLKKEKVIDNQEKCLTFRELLKNYTLQNNYYKIEEMSLLELLEKINFNNGMISYPDYSEIKSGEVKHLSDKLDLELTYKDKKLTASLSEEDNDLIEIDIYEDDNEKENMLKRIKLNIKKLPINVKKEINEYLDDLISRYTSENDLNDVKKLKEIIDFKNNNKRRVI